MRRPRKINRRVASATEALTTTALALADAKQRGAGLSLETTFPGGRMIVYVGSFDASLAQIADRQ